MLSVVCPTCCWYHSGCSTTQDLCFVTYLACYPAGHYVIAAVLRTAITDTLCIVRIYALILQLRSKPSYFDRCRRVNTCGNGRRKLIFHPHTRHSSLIVNNTSTVRRGKFCVVYIHRSKILLIVWRSISEYWTVGCQAR
jgi:hypothetical protein